MALIRSETRPRPTRAMRFGQALLGVPDPQDTQAPAWASGALILLLMLGAWRLGFASGGSSIVPPHWFYLPIGVAAARFRYLGGVAIALAAGFLAGPLLPASVEAGTAQPVSDWGSRTGFFVAIGLFVAWLVSLYRDATYEVRSSRAVANALMGTVRLESSPTHVSRERIQAALKPESFHIVVQPIVSMETREAVGFEALARFSLDPQRPPDEWFTEAWGVGLGIDLELAALHRAVDLLADLPEGFLSVNLSPATLMSPSFRSSIWALPGERLVVEMTEHVPVSDYNALREVLLELREQGIRYAIDDAGAGYASLRHVIRLNPDIIKVDNGLVRGLDRNPLLRSITSALIRFGEEAGALTVAEGVETEAEAQALRALGARYAQGFLFAPPLPVRQIAALATSA